MNALNNTPRSLHRLACGISSVLIATLLIMLSSAIELPAQSYEPELVDPITEKWRWIKFHELEGKGVRCITEDQLGNVWFGVNQGVLTYNGRFWTHHKPEHGIPAIPIEQIVAMKNGDIYCSSEKGIYRYAHDTWEVIFETISGSTFTSYKMEEISDGSLLLATNEGVVQIREGKVSRIFTSPHIQEGAAELFGVDEIVALPGVDDEAGSFHISDILEDSRDNLWFALSLGNHGKLIRFKQRDISNGNISDHTLFESNKSVQLGEDQRLIETVRGDIWVVNRSIKSGVHIFDGKSWETHSFNTLFGTDEYCTGIMQTPDGTIWVTSLGKLFTYRDGEWNIYRSSGSRIPTHKIILAKSNDQRIWVSGLKTQTYLFDYSSKRWASYDKLNFQCEANGESWFIDADGRVALRSEEDWIFYGPKDGLIDAPVRLISTSADEIWAAGSHEGAAATAVFRDGKWTRHLHPQLSWGIDYRAVLEAFDGTIWFGGAVDFDMQRGQIGGVLQMKYDEAGRPTWIHHKYQENGLSQSNAYGIGQSRDSLIWIGGGSLLYYDGSRWNTADNPLLNDFINVVSSTPSGLLLVGSRYYGVFIYDGEDWKIYNTESGLVSNTIMAIHGTDEDFIFAATGSDISRFDGENWVNHVFPEQMNINFEGGSIETDANGAIWINRSPREWKRRAYMGKHLETDQKLEFAAYSYNPDNDAPDTHIDVFNERVSQKGNTLITWIGEDFMSSTPADRLSYSYRLNEGPWSAFSHETHHTFLNLSNGWYTLEVRARDLDMNIDPTPARIEFRVMPPVWKQPWFLLLMLAFILVIGVFEYRVLRKNKILFALNNSLSSINAELHNKNHQIEQKNQENVRQQEQILEQKKQLEESFKNLSSQNTEIEFQRDKLAAMVVQIEELNKSKINFFTNVSHELRTPLTLILGPAHELQNKLENITVEKRKKLYKIIERNAYKLLKLINQLLEMRRIENNQLELAVSEGNISAFLAEISQLFENLASERQIDFQFIDNCQLEKFVFDEDKVEKIVTNLVSNAFKHTPIHGRILLKIESVAPEGNDTHEYVRISVSDNGTGISADRMPHIFERYYSDNADRLSSGIGLTYIKDLVEVHGGTIQVESVKGVGTTFTVDLPLNRVDKQEPGRAVAENNGFIMSASEISHLFSLIEPDPESEVQPATRPDKKSILIVENDADLLDFLSVMLEEKYNIYKAYNGLSGLDIARNNQIDLVLSDVMMPQMDGLEMCHHLKSDLVTSHIPVILLTAKAMDDNRMQGYIQGADAYMTKPFNPDVLQSRIENLLTQRAQLRDVYTRDFILKPKHVELESVDDELLNNIVRIMEENIDESDFNVNKMCHMVGMSHTHFIRKVKQLTGKKPIDLLKAFRLNRAKDLLAQNSANIAEIAYMVGYNVPNSFSRAFKKEFGMSPKEYVEQFGESAAGKGSRAPSD